MQTMSPTGTGSRSQNFNAGSEKKEKETSTAATAVAKANELAKEVGCSVANKADQATLATGREIEHLAEKIRDHSPDSGMLGAASNNLADSLQKSGKYLEERGLDGICSDLTSVVRSNPITSIAIAAGIGFLMARATPSRST